MSTEKVTDIVTMKPGPLRPMPRSFSLMPETLGQAMELAKIIAESDFAPKDYKGKPGNVIIAIQMGADIGLKPMQALQNIAVINGRPSIYGDAALALAYGADVLEKFDEKIEGEGDKRTATCAIRRKGFPDEIVRTFSVGDAKKANLWGKAGPWTTYPDRMLQMRARGFALRDGASDVLMGLVLAEEAQDYQPIQQHAGEIVEATVVSDPMERIPEGLRDNVEKAFATLNLAPGLRIAKINEFLGAEGVTPEDGATTLLTWCRDEFAKRKTGQPVQRADNSKRPPAPAGGSAGGVSAADPQQSAVAQPAGDAASAPLTVADIPFAGSPQPTASGDGSGKVGF